MLLLVNLCTSKYILIFKLNFNNVLTAILFIFDRNFTSSFPPPSNTYYLIDKWSTSFSISNYIANEECPLPQQTAEKIGWTPAF